MEPNHNLAEAIKMARAGPDLSISVALNLTLLFFPGGDDRSNHGANQHWKKKPCFVRYIPEHLRVCCRVGQLWLSRVYFWNVLLKLPCSVKLSEPKLPVTSPLPSDPFKLDVNGDRLALRVG